MLLLDTDVMIDILRGYQPALDWLGSLDEEVPELPGLVVMELMQGCQTKEEMAQLLKLLEPFGLRWPTGADCERALKDFAEFHLSGRLGVLDALIGECTVGLDASLCTFNVKHFRTIPQLVTLQPYQKGYVVPG